MASNSVGGTGILQRETPPQEHGAGSLEVHFVGKTESTGGTMMRFAILSVALLLLCASSLYALDKDGLVLYLPLDDKVAKDMSGNGNDAKY